MGQLTRILASLAVVAALAPACDDDGGPNGYRNDPCTAWCDAMLEEGCSPDDIGLPETFEECFDRCKEDNGWEPCVDERIAIIECVAALSCGDRFTYWEPLTPIPVECQGTQTEFTNCTMPMSGG